MAKVAVLVDLDFFIHRYRALHAGQENSCSARQVAQAVHRTAIAHVTSRREVRRQGDCHCRDELYKVLVYDCRPLTKKAHNPVDGKAIDFSKTDQALFRTELHQELLRLRKVALRLGELMHSSLWVLRPRIMQSLLAKKLSIEQLKPDDVIYQAAQKGVDIKFGIDIASLAYKKLADRLVLITGDSDFVPAAKLARREGLDVVLDPLWNPISPSLREHIDGLRTIWPRPQGRATNSDAFSVSANRSDEQECA